MKDERCEMRDVREDWRGEKRETEREVEGVGNKE